MTLYLTLKEVDLAGRLGWVLHMAGPSPGSWRHHSGADSMASREHLCLRGAGRREEGGGEGFGVWSERGCEQRGVYCSIVGPHRISFSVFTYISVQVKHVSD